MKKIFWSLLMAGICLEAMSQAIPNDPKAITFKIKNFGLTVEGSVSGLNGEIRVDPDNLAKALFDVSVDANSIDTGIALRDNHLRKEEYLDVKNYPQINFVSKSIVKVGKSNTWILTGELTIKKVTKEISFPFLMSNQNGKSSFTGEFKINRRDFDVGGRSMSMANEILVILKVKS